MPRVFVSYRRDGTTAVTGRIYDRLIHALGADQVFKDVDNIPLGEDFRHIIEQEVAGCDALLVIIGPEWASATAADGRPRLADPSDFVRIEVEEGLKRNDVRVVPVLVENSAMPGEEDLPEALRPLSFRQAAVVRNDPDFNRDVEGLIDILREGGPVPVSPPASKGFAGARRFARPWLLAAVTAILLSVIGIYLFYSSSPEESGPPAVSPENVSRLEPVRELQHSDEVSALAFSPDGGLLASGSGRRIFLWDVETGAQIRAVGNHWKSVLRLEFSPDGKRLLSGGDREVMLWDVDAGELIHKLDGNHGLTFFVAVSPDGRFGLSGGESKAVLWDLETGQSIHRLTEYAAGGVFRPDLETAVVAYQSDTLGLWDLSTGKMIREFKGGGKSGTDNADVFDVALAPDGETVLALWETGCIVIWNSATGDEDICGIHGRGTRLAVSPQGKLIATAGRDAISLIDPDANREVRRLIEKDGPSRDVAFSADGKTIATGGGDKIVRLWRVSGVAAQ